MAGKQTQNSAASVHANAPEKINQPDANQKLVPFNIEPGHSYIFNFDPKLVKAAFEKDGDLVIQFTNNSSVVLKGYESAMDADFPPALSLANGTVVSGDSLIGSLVLSAKDVHEDTHGVQKPQMNAGNEVQQAKEGAEAAQAVEQKVASETEIKLSMDDSAQKFAEIEPAAGGAGGGAGGGGGYGFQSSFVATPVSPLADVGPIGPTALQYGVEFRQAEVLPGVNAAAPPAKIIPPEFDLQDFQVKEDGAVKVVIDAINDNPTLPMVITYSGIPTGWTVDTSASGGTFNAAAGTWTITVAAGVNEYMDGPVFHPPANSDADLGTLTVTMTVTDSLTGDSATSTGTSTITTDAVADKPDIHAVDRTTTEGHTVNVTINAALKDTDGSETITGYKITGVPAGFTFNHGTDAGGGVWTFTPAEISGLKLTPSNSNFTGTVNLTVTVFNAETNLSGGEFDTTDNTNSNSDILTLNFTPVINPPTITVNNGVDDVQVKEDGSVKVKVVAHLGANPDADEFLTVKVTGIDSKWGFSAPVGTYDSATGTWTVVLPAGQNLNTLLTFIPPHNSDIDLTGLVATVVATDPSENLTATASDGFNIVVDAVADKPAFDAVDRTTTEGHAINVTLNATLKDTDGSETITGYKITGVPSGFTFNHGTNVGGGVWTFTPADINGLKLTPPANYNGTLNLTATVFNAETNLHGTEYDTTDNTNSNSDPLVLTFTPVIHPPTITVNNSIDDAKVKEDGSVDVKIVAHLGANPGPNEFLTIKVTGIDSKWGFSAPVGTYNAATGTWTVTLAPGQNLDTLMTFKPPHNSDLDLSGLVATVVAKDTDTGQTANAHDDFNIITDAVADKPTLNISAASGEEGKTIPLTIKTAVTDKDGSEVIEKITISGLPAGATLTAGTFAGGVWTLTPAQLAGLGIKVPDGVHGTFNLTVTSTSFEQNLGGSEYDLTDNRATTTDTLTLTVGVDSVPVIGDDSKTIDETNLGPITINGAVAVDFKADTAGSTLKLTGFSSTGSKLGGNLTSHGTAVAVTLSGNTYVGKAGGVEIFRLTLNADGTYTFKQSGPIDHADGTNANDVINLKFVVTGTDGDGDKDTGTITIAIKDDAPVAVNDTVKDTSLSAVTGNVLSNDTLSHDASNTVTKIVFNGTSFTVPGGSTATIVGTYGTLKIGSDGSYIYTAKGGADGVDTFTYTLKDYDGDTSTATLKITVDVDDKPVIGDSAKTVDETNLGPITVTGAVSTSYGTDGPGKVKATGVSSFSANGSELAGKLTSHGTAVKVTLVGDTYIGKAGSHDVFSLKINEDGTYTFKMFDSLDHANATNPDDVINLVFGVTGTDSDGDTDAGTITISVKDDAPIAVDDSRSTGQGSTITGNVIANDHVGHDTPGTITKIAFGATTVNIPTTGSVSINGDHGKLTVAADGSYTYKSTDGGTDHFTYTLKDGDGDTDLGVLTIKSDPSVLIVGENVDDDSTSKDPHHVGGGIGEIVGKAGADILVGDVGGSILQPQHQDHNVVLILDVSGSMNTSPDSRIELLKQAVNHLMKDFNAYDQGEIKVHIVPFSTDVHTSGTFDVSTAAGYQAAVNFINGLTADGLTNYEAPLQDAISWLQSGQLIPGGLTTTYFVSDGEPNRYVDEHGNVVGFGDDDSVILGEITGSDGSDEVGTLQSLSDGGVFGVGIDIGDDALANIDAIDSKGQAINVQDPKDLDDTFQALSPINNLNAGGDDVIRGNDGNDLMFGDVVYTDTLASAMHLNTNAGAGWEVFERLEAGESSVKPGWTRADTVAYIQNHAAEIGKETVDNGGSRHGGDDHLYGGAGNDVIFGQEGNDVISGDAGNDTLYGGSGSDIFLFDSLADGTDTVKDFKSAEGDKLDISALLSKYDPLQDSINDFVFKTVVNGSTVISVDVNGSGDASHATTIAVLQGVTTLNLEDITNNGQPIA